MLDRVYWRAIYDEERESYVVTQAGWVDGEPQIEYRFTYFSADEDGDIAQMGGLDKWWLNEDGDAEGEFVAFGKYPDETEFEADVRRPLRFLIQDRDSKFAGSFDQGFISEGFEIVRTPFRAPKANAVAERWVRSVRQACLDQLLILNQRHLARVLKEYTHYYNTARPHQGLGQQTPIPRSQSRRGIIRCRDVLGGILHDYYRDVA